MPSAAPGIRRTLRRYATCLLIAVFACAGCGDDDSETDVFSEGYNAAIQRLAQVNEDLADLQTSRSSRAIAREFDDFAVALQRTRAELAALEPPQTAAAEFDGLLTALDDSVAASRRAARAARAIKPARQRQAVRALRRATAEVADAEDELRRAVESG
jgi:hypothetical protein